MLKTTSQLRWYWIWFSRSRSFSTEPRSLHVVHWTLSRVSQHLSDGMINSHVPYGTFPSLFSCLSLCYFPDPAMHICALNILFPDCIFPVSPQLTTFFLSFKFGPGSLFCSKIFAIAESFSLEKKLKHFM